MKHTPGPWTKDGNIIRDFTGTGVAQVFAGSANSSSAISKRHYHHISIEEKEINARLITAAPELLHVCKMCLDRRGMLLSREDIQRINRIIAKAEGGE